MSARLGWQWKEADPGQVHPTRWEEPRSPIQFGQIQVAGPLSGISCRHVHPMGLGGTVAAVHPGCCAEHPKG